MKTKHVVSSIALLITAVLFSSFTLVGHAGFKEYLTNHPETRASLVTTVIKNRLSLTDDQSMKIYGINLKYARLMQPYFESEDGLEANREAAKELNKQRKNEIKELLTKDQLDKIEELKKLAIKKLEILLDELKSNN